MRILGGARPARPPVNPSLKITSLFGPGPRESPKHLKNTSTDIIHVDESSELAVYSSKGNCSLKLFHDHNDIKLSLVEKNPEYSRRTLTILGPFPVNPCLTVIDQHYCLLVNHQV